MYRRVELSEMIKYARKLSGWQKDGRGTVRDEKYGGIVLVAKVRGGNCPGGKRTWEIVLLAKGGRGIVCDSGKYDICPNASV